MPSTAHKKQQQQHRGRGEQVPQEEDDGAIMVDDDQQDDDGLHQVLPPPPSSSVFRRVLCGDSSKQAALIRLFGVLILAFVLNIVVTVKYSSSSRREGQVVSSSSSSSSRISALLNNATLPNWKPLPDASTTITKIAFGSCNSQEAPQPHWDTIVNEFDPSVFLLTGDNVYGDCDDDSCWNLREAYRKMAHHPSVQGGATQLAVFATLDDHDYGQGDCHADNPFKVVAKELFAEFFDIPPQDLPEDGVYRSRTWGPVGQRLQVILLDTRYARSPFLETGIQSSPYTPPIFNSTSTTQDKEEPQQQQQQQMLSETQWNWLEQQLMNEPADLRLIVSSIQVLNNGTGFEAWRHLPAERDRLYTLLQRRRSKKEGGGGVILLTGDRHTGGLYESNGLVEVTASSFTHTIPLGTFHKNGTTPAECDEVDPSRVGDLIRENHFGSITIDWSAKTVTVALQRAESSYGSVYKQKKKTDMKKKHAKYTDAGEVLLSKQYHFSEL